MKIPIEISARHIHLSREDLDKLFGRGYELKFYNKLSQASDFAAAEKVIIAGPKGSFPAVRIIGPCREKTQIEISATDARFLGVDAPLRISGDIRGSAGIRIKGPKGEARLKEGTIIAKRHIHLNQKEAAKLKIRGGKKVSVEIKGPRGAVFREVTVRVGEKYKLSMHIDTDEANAAGVKDGEQGIIVR